MTANSAGLTAAGADERLEQIADWLSSELHIRVVRLEPASHDASFRRYFRAWSADGATRVIMDAPPDKEDIAPFLSVAALLVSSGVHVPQVEAADTRRGFVLLEDLGTVLYLTRLRAGDDPEPLYTDALQALLQMQVSVEQAHTLPPYDRAVLEREMALMPEWFCARHLQLTLSAEERGLLASTFDLLAVEALAQPRVFVHRDYHSRNLLLLGQRNPGIVDFQDALYGPVTYDLVSLLKDCYIDWPRERIERWVSQYRARLAAAGGPAGQCDQQFLRWFDFIGLQRHIKVLGIFARLWWRDGKSAYLGDLPRTLEYVQDAAERYAQLAPFAVWLERRVAPLLAVANAQALRQAASA
jgi:hypothetical protein